MQRKDNQENKPLVEKKALSTERRNRLALFLEKNKNPPKALPKDKILKTEVVTMSDGRRIGLE